MTDRGGRRIYSKFTTPRRRRSNTIKASFDRWKWGAFVHDTVKPFGVVVRGRHELAGVVELPIGKERER